MIRLYTRSLFHKAEIIAHPQTAWVSSVISTKMKAVQVRSPGGPENLYIGDAATPEVKPNEVLIKVRCSALNRLDLLQRKGLYPPPPGTTDILGVEASGEIAGVGGNVTSGWKVGDRVMALLPGGGQAEFAAIDERQVIPIPVEMSFEVAAAIPEVWLTAYQLLFFVGKLKRGETVLVHAAGSGVGTSLVQLAKAQACTVITTARSNDKLAKTKELGADLTLNTAEDKNFSKKVLEFTKRSGVDLILDPIGSEFWQENAACLAMDSRWLIYGLMGGADVSGPILRSLLARRAALLTSTLRSRDDDYKGELVSAFRRDVMPSLANNTFQPVIDTILPFQQVRQAHERMESNSNTGKIILRWE
eukprot:TRINITY_DN8003_c0_g1::TRINITY_DN8003_c0_g1_i1::g.15489::m.15489 TRINITY_DN8003_c0_g1::TRINITY_DN8003_c0_g1_i1::g.15489  ORF type:complete len:361 (-),score=39.46,sp/Q53FA7/QORX_HUMAN/48.79/3e-111,ADH_zinc_N/PF00107.21/1.6e-20,ADH_zinc_N_2/PF13602.1/4.6e-13,ADH_N/PF08240.7/1.9e-09,ADH_N/PF08240.7/2.2e+03,ADH_N/PF08240.7/1.8e+03 TRINITY_DN8003_c0_g1_i1:443-1525(-)